jgi:hypothetical protein
MMGPLSDEGKVEIKKILDFLEYKAELKQRRPQE